MEIIGFDGQAASTFQANGSFSRNALMAQGLVAEGNFTTSPQIREVTVMEAGITRQLPVRPELRQGPEGMETWFIPTQMGQSMQPNVAVALNRI